MCIVIDTNTLASVFDQTDSKHQEFKPVLDWIRYGKGKVVFGGTKYKEELKKKYLGIFLDLRRAKKAVYIDDEIVDEESKKVSTQIEHKDFDDQHIVGLLKASGCKLICSLDERAYPYFTHSLFFSPANKRPKIYAGLRSADILNDRNIAPCCLPSLPTTNAQRVLLKII